MRAVFVIRVMILALACLASSAAAPKWRWSNPFPHGANIYAMANRGSFVVQVGELGQIYATDDLVEWMPRNSGVQNSLRSATWVGTRLVITGSEGVVLYSDDLVNFTPIHLGTADWLEGVAASSTRAVAVGDSGAIYSSVDGTNWARQANAPAWLRSVAYGGGKFMTVGEAGYIASSPDGLNWTPLNRPTSKDLNKVVWLDNRFWIVGNAGAVHFSDNATIFHTLNVGAGTNDLFDAAYNANEIVFVGRNELRSGVSPYTTWTSQLGEAPAPPPGWTYYCAIWDGSEFLVGGRSGIFVEGFRPPGGNSTVWFTYSEPARNWIWSLTRAGDIYAASGEKGGIFTSVDGFRFDQEVVPDSASLEILEGIGGTSDLLVAVGTAGTVLWSPGGYTNVVSTNASGARVTNQVSLLGLEWNAVFPRPTLNELQGIGFYNGLYIATGGNGTILTSPNGRNWTGRLSGSSQHLSSVAPSPSRIVVTGDRGTILTSDNGTSYSSRTSGVTNWIYQACFSGGQFVAVGEAGLVLTSPDGIAWTRRTSGTTRWLNTVTHREGSFYAAGTGGLILKSVNGIEWSVVPSPMTKSIYGLAGADGRILAAGLEGAAIRARLIPWTTPVNFLTYGREGPAHAFVFTGELDQTFNLEKSSNLTNWVEGPDLEILDNSGAFFYFESAGRAAQLYLRTKTSAP